MKTDQDKLNAFIEALTETLEAHAAALSELYSNQKSLTEAVNAFGDMNKKLMDAIVRQNNVQVN